MESLSNETHDTILDIDDKFDFDDSIQSLNYQPYTPQTQSNNNTRGQSIKIDINAQDAYVLPSKSYISIKGQIRRVDNNAAYAADAEITLINNALMYLFSGIKYEINNTNIENISSSPGQVTSMLGYLSQPDDFNTSSGLKYCWSKDTTDHASSVRYTKAGGNVTGENATYNQGFSNRKGFIFSSDPRGSFSFIVPISHIFGFSEYKRVIYGVKHSLTLTRDGDTLALYRHADAENGKVDITEIVWNMPHVEMSTEYLIGLRKLIVDKVTIPMVFRARTSDSTTVTQTRDYTWRLSVTGGVEKPRWIIIAFQTGRSDSQETNPALFDHCNLTNAYVTLNSERYPQTEITTNFAANDYAKLYDMFDDFKKEYYGIDSLVGGTQVSFPTFKTLFPIIVFDVRRQKEKLKTGVIDMQAKFFFSANVPANTMAYSVIISDRFFKLSSDGVKMNVISM